MAAWGEVILSGGCFLGVVERGSDGCTAMVELSLCGGVSFPVKGCGGVVIVFKEVDYPLQEIYPGKDDKPDKDPVKH